MTLTQAVAALKRGEVLAVATDTVYGLVADPRNQAAVDHLFTLKGRARHHPLQVLAASPEQARSLITIPLRAEGLTKHWPGPLTLVSHSKQLFANGVGEKNRQHQTKLGVRVPRNSTALKLLLAFGGPLAASSANRSGQVDSISASQVRRVFPKGLGGLLEADREVQHAASSTVVDVTDTPWRILRQGVLRITPH